MKKYLILFCLLSNVVVYSQKYQSNIGVGTKIYIFDDWQLNVIKPTWFSILYTYQIKERYNFVVDFDFYNIKVYPSNKYLNTAYGRLFVSSGISLEKLMFRNINLNAGIRYKFGNESRMGKFLYDYYRYEGGSLGFQCGINYYVQLARQVILQPEIGYQYYTKFTHSQYYLGMHLDYMFHPIKRIKKKK
jgi:hypothetical protein